MDKDIITTQTEIEAKGKGRPTKLTPERAEKIISLIRAGNYRNVASVASGVAIETFCSWMRKGKKAKSGIYYQFMQAIQKAESESEARNVIAIQKDDSWQAKMTFLERKWPERWGRRDRTEHTGKDGGPIELTAISPEERRQRIEELERRRITDGRTEDMDRSE